MIGLCKRLLLVTVFLCCAEADVCPAQGGGEPGIAWSLKNDPKTLDPAKAGDQATELLRYLTGGVLLRMNRRTQQIEPWLASG